MNYDAVVIGTIFVDIKGFPQGEYLPRGRNVGDVHFFHGGVGRNVVESMAQLGPKTTFVSTVDQSGLGTEVIERLQEMDVDVSFLQTGEKGMGMWMAILNEQGDLAGSISQMPSVQFLEDSVLSQTDLFLEQSNHVVLEIDLTEKIAETVIQKAQEKELKVYGIPGNLEVMKKRKDFLEHVQCFICNEVEAEQLTSVPIDTEENIKKAARKFTETGLKQIVITLGEEGCYYYDTISKEEGFLKPEKVQVVDTTGAGDSFFAGTISALIKGQSLADAVQLGTHVAAITISIPESTSQELNEKLQGKGIKL